MPTPTSNTTFSKNSPTSSLSANPITTTPRAIPTPTSKLSSPAPLSHSSSTTANLSSAPGREFTSASTTAPAPAPITSKSSAPSSPDTIALNTTIHPPYHEGLEVVLDDEH